MWSKTNLLILTEYITYYIYICATPLVAPTHPPLEVPTWTPVARPTSSGRPGLDGLHTDVGQLELLRAQRDLQEPLSGDAGRSSGRRCGSQ